MKLYRTVGHNLGITLTSRLRSLDIKRWKSFFFCE